MPVDYRARDEETIEMTKCPRCKFSFRREVCPDGKTRLVETGNDGISTAHKFLCKAWQHYSNIQREVVR